MQEENDGKLAIERTKIEIDVVKHLSTLSTGSIVLVTTFLDKLPKPLSEPRLLRLSLGLFSCSIVTSVLYLLAPWADKKEWRHSASSRKVCFFLAGVAFLGGAVFLAVFARFNVGISK